MTADRTVYPLPRGTPVELIHHHSTFDLGTRGVVVDDNPYYFAPLVEYGDAPRITVTTPYEYLRKL